MQRRGYYNQSNIPDIDLMPYLELDNFVLDSSNMDTKSTMMKMERDGKNEKIIYFNGNGIISEFKRKIKKATK